MDVGSLSSAASSSSTPLTVFNNGSRSQQLKAHPAKVIGQPNTSASRNQTRTRRPVQVKALKGSAERRTLSSNWDLSITVKPAPLLPRFEELDTTNMLLRDYSSGSKLWG